MGASICTIETIRMIDVVIVGEEDISSTVLAYETDMHVSLVQTVDFDTIISHIAMHRPSIIVVDGDDEQIDVDILSYVCSLRCPEAQIIVLIEGAPDFQMLQSSGFKVRGYISREQRPMLAKAIRVIHDGEAWLPRKLVAEMLDYFSTELAMNSPRKLKLVNS